MSFNPRTHTGCDVNQAVKNKQDKLFQSTHPHGVRQGIGEGGDLVFEFQSTHPHGVRPAELHQLTRHSRFNPRTHTGCDIGSIGLFTLTSSFNPRTHTGCDKDQQERLGQLQQVSIHAPTRGATQYGVLPSDAIMFQSTHPHGVRPC